MYASPTLLPAFTQHLVSAALPRLTEPGRSPSRQSRAEIGALATQPNPAPCLDKIVKVLSKAPFRFYSKNDD